MERKIRLGIVEVFISDPDFRIETHQIYLTRDGTVEVPEDIASVEGLESLRTMIEANKEKIIAMLFSNDCCTGQHSWCNETEQKKGVVVGNGCSIRLAPADWETFVACYNKLTGYDIGSADSLNAIKQKVEEGNFFLVASREYGFVVGENIFLLDDGTYLHNHVGKYKSGITFICNREDLHKNIFEEDRKLDQKLNFGLKPDDRLSFVTGDYYISRKGKSCFDRTTENPKHVLIAHSWERTSKTPIEIRSSAFYYKQSRSNIGRSGVDYMVLPISVTI